MFKFGSPLASLASASRRCRGVVLLGGLVSCTLLQHAPPARAAEGIQGSAEVVAAGIAEEQPELVTLRVPLPPPVPRLFAITPERRALLNTIRYAEGTWANGQDIGYRVMFGGGLMPSLDAHPNRVIRTRRYASAAAGAYQFMPPTWRNVTRALGFSLNGPNAFGPQVQDQGALYLIQRRGALNLADQGQFTPELSHRLSPEWASFPTRAGHSYYGQPVKRFHELRRFYEANLSQLRAAQSQTAGDLQIQVQPPKPACTPADSLRCRIEALDELGPRSSGVRQI